MKYFIRSSQRAGTLYHEFCEGQWDESAYWADSSLLIHDDVLHDTGLGRLLMETVSDYDYYGHAVVFPEHWEEIKRLAVKQGGPVEEVVQEARLWVESSFEEHGCFTIIGI